MTDYVKLTDFAAKDAMTTGNPAKIVKGTEINDEFAEIETHIATKADLVSPAFSGTPTAPTPTAGANGTRIATTAFVQGELLTALPVGTVLFVAFATPPAGYLECDGTAISRAGYADLFAVIGETFGAGDGSTTFNLPTFTPPANTIYVIKY